MLARIYHVDTHEIVATITGETHKMIEDHADTLGFMGVDMFGLTYCDKDLEDTGDHDVHFALFTAEDLDEIIQDYDFTDEFGECDDVLKSAVFDKMNNMVCEDTTEAELRRVCQTWLN